MSLLDTSLETQCSAGTHAAALCSKFRVGPASAAGWLWTLPSAKVESSVGRIARPQRAETHPHLQGNRRHGRTVHQHFYFRGLANSDQNRIRNIIAQRWAQQPGGSVPVSLPLGVVLPRSLQVVEVEVGHHVSHGQHQPVQALVVVQTPGHSFLGSLPLHSVIWQQ